MEPAVAESITELKNDTLHGAGWLSRYAIDTLNLAINKSQARTIASFMDETGAVAAELAAARPGMISIANYVHQCQRQIAAAVRSEKDMDHLKSRAQDECSRLISLSEEAALKSSEYCCETISNQDILITCSYSSTVCKAFEMAAQKGTEFNVMVAESMVNGKAHGQMTARRLQQHRIPVKLIPDDLIELRVPQANKVLVGADSILADGSLVNGSPTLTLAHAAREGKIDFYTVCETAKFDVEGLIPEGAEPAPGFDKVPPGLITAIITEKGIIPPGLVTAYVEEKTRAWQAAVKGTTPRA